MDDKTIRSWLVEAGLREKAVERLLEDYKKARTRYREKEYAEVGVHVGRFCEAITHILRLEIGSELKQEDVREFAADCLHDDFANNYSDAINQHIPNMLNTAYDIRSNRDAAHLNLETAVNRADARLGIALCSSMLVELLREFVEIDDEKDINEITTVINQLSESIEETPLDSLVVSRFDFNQNDVATAIEDIVVIVEEDEAVEPGSDFSELAQKQQITALALGRLAGCELEYLENPGAKPEWFVQRVDFDKSRTQQILDDLDFFTKDWNHGGYHIPGYQASDAVAFLE